MSAVPPVAIVGGRYRLTTCIGQGGMGSVWHAEHVSLRTPVAVKLLDPQLADVDGLRARFVREARAAAALRGDDVVRILDHGEEGGLPYIVMEYLEGESLGDRLDRAGPLSTELVGHVMASVCRAIARAHKLGIVHRDLKPDNVFLLHGDAPLPHVKVLDFGIAKVLADAKSLSETHASTATGSTLGTPYYMGPEQIRATKDIDQRADLWALAVIAFECLTGRRPFTGESMGDLALKICHEPVPVPSTVAPVPDGFDAWFARATLRPLHDRFQTVEELASELALVLTPGRAWIEDRGSIPADVRRSAPPREVVATQRNTTRSVPPPPPPTSARRIAAAAVGTLALMTATFVVYEKVKTPAVTTASSGDRVTVDSVSARSERGGALRAEPPLSLQPLVTAAPVASASASSPRAGGSAASSARPSTSSGAPSRPFSVASSRPTNAAPSGAPAGTPQASSGFTGVD